MRPRIIKKYKEICGGDAEMLTVVLQQKAPICCFLGDVVVSQVILYALEGKIYNGVDGPMKGAD